MRPLVAAPRPEPGFVVGAFRAVDLAVDACAGARFVEVVLAVDACAGARFVEVVLADDFLAEAFFADFDLGGLA